MSVARAMREVDAREFSEWQAFDYIEPFGDRRADWRMAQLLAMIANMFRGKRSKRAKLTDFMWRDTPPKPKQTLQEQRGIFANMIATVFKRDLTKE